MEEVVVLDTNVVVAAFYSKRGPSNEVIRKLSTGAFRIAVSVPLVMEYEEVLKRELDREIFSDEDIEKIVDYLCAHSEHTKIFYLWRPYLKDANDDHILELSLASNAKYIVTYNLKDLVKAKDFGKIVLTPEEYLAILRRN